MNKPSPLSNLRSITPEQADQLFELLRGTAYHAAVAWVAQEWGLPVSVAGLQRWWKRETARRARSDLRAAIAISEKFDVNIDARQLDARAANAIRASLWNALTTKDNASIKTLADLVLDYNADARGRCELELKERAQQTKDEALRLAREKFDAAEKRLAEVREAVAAGRTQDGGLSEESVRRIEEAAKLL
ncbi:MAG: hypothetical protein FWG50_13085 [Kiritimatiellaeota bacterium]|nr:hypothetical protein [Kiritimatiellota bacterium]